MKGYGFMLFPLVGFVWTVSAQQMHPKLAGTWQSTDGPCTPCTLTIQANGLLTFALEGSEIRIVFSNFTPAPGLDLVFQRGGGVNLKLSADTVLVGFYTPPTRVDTFEIVAFHRR